MILSVILAIIVAVGVGLIVSQWELYRPEQLNELKDLYKVKGKYEQNTEDANSKAVVKKADDLIVLLSKREERDAKWMDVCDKRLREAEIEARQLITQIAALVQQKDQLNSTYRSCVEHLEACKYKTE